MEGSVYIYEWMCAAGATMRRVPSSGRLMKRPRDAGEAGNARRVAPGGGRQHAVPPLVQ